MLNIPYIPQPDPKSCALASNSMVAKYFFPEMDFEKTAEISDWKPGFAVWSFKFWLWMLEKGIRITNFDSIDYEGWAEKGVQALKDSVPSDEYEFYIKNTFNLDTYQEDIKKIIDNPNFSYFRRKPTMADLGEALEKGVVCEVVLNSPTLSEEKRISLHRVVVLEVSNESIVFHDPGSRGEKYKVKRELFEKSWLGELSAPELCVYEKANLK
jgi:hypothetical protein